MSNTDSPLAPTPDEIQAFLALHNLTQTQFAAHLGVTKNAIQKWRDGDRTPPAFLSLALRQLETDLTRRPLEVRDPKWGEHKLKRFTPDELFVGMRVGDAQNKFAFGEIIGISAVGGRCHVRWTAHDGTIKETRRCYSGLKRLPPEIVK